MKPDYDPFGIRGKPTKEKFKLLGRPPKRDDPHEVLFNAHAMLSTDYLEEIVVRACAWGIKPKVVMPTGEFSCMELINTGRCKSRRCPYDHDVNNAAQWKYWFSKTPCSGGPNCIRRNKGCLYRHQKPEKPKPVKKDVEKPTRRRDKAEVEKSKSMVKTKKPKPRKERK